jgi:hypothetical protein
VRQLLLGLLPRLQQATTSLLMLHSSSSSSLPQPSSSSSLPQPLQHIRQHTWLISPTTLLL